MDGGGMNDIRLLDLGLTLNAQIGREIWHPRELLQADFYLGGVHVWLAWNTIERWARVAVGDNPRELMRCRAVRM